MVRIKNALALCQGALIPLKDPYSASRYFKMCSIAASSIGLINGNVVRSSKNRMLKELLASQKEEDKDVSTKEYLFLKKSLNVLMSPYESLVCPYVLKSLPSSLFLLSFPFGCNQNNKIIPTPKSTPPG